MKSHTQTQALSLILGGTGKTGRRIAHKLSARGEAIRIGSRSGRPAFSWDAPGNWHQVLEGIDKIYLNFAPDLAIPGAAESIAALTDCAVAAGVKRLVLLSGRGEEEAQRCETLVQRPELEWTIVRASWFAQNFSEGAFINMVRNGEVFLPAGAVQEPFIDAEDIAEVAVAALCDSGHAGKIYEVTGPRLLTFAEAIQEISSATGRKIRYRQIPVQDFIQAARAEGMPENMLWLLKYLFTTVLDGRNAYLADGVQKALGREPADFRDYASKAARAGVWSEAA